jgi:hypothetical protein
MDLHVVVCHGCECGCDEAPFAAGAYSTRDLAEDAICRFVTEDRGMSHRPQREYHVDTVGVDDQ